MVGTKYEEDEVLKRMLNTPHKDQKPITPLGIQRRRDRESGADPKARPAKG